MKKVKENIAEYNTVVEKPNLKFFSIQQTVKITNNRQLHLDFEIPSDIPIGEANVELKIIPFVKKEENPVIDENAPPLKCLIGVKTPRSDRLLGAAANLGNTTPDEIRDEWLTEKYLK